MIKLTKEQEQLKEMQEFVDLYNFCQDISISAVIERVDIEFAGRGENLPVEFDLYKKEE